MNFDAFSGGIEPGGLRNKSDIGILICYMLHNINSPFPEDDIIIHHRIPLVNERNQYYF